MSKLSHDQIADEVAKKDFTLVNDNGYININSRIVVKCKNNHLIETCLSDVRKVSFCCPICDRNLDFVNPAALPAKNGAYRIVAFDQATENFGVSVFDNGNLVYYKLFVFSGSMNTRLCKIDQFVRDVVIKKWEPDFIVMEDIQYQNGIMTYKILAMLLGVVQTACTVASMPFECVSPNVWRKYAGTCGKNRQEEKKLSVALVKEKYGINVSDDVAEAILIGRYGTTMHKPKVEMAFGVKK